VLSGGCDCRRYRGEVGQVSGAPVLRSQIRTVPSVLAEASQDSFGATTAVAGELSGGCFSATRPSGL
jgi:hypothetical protein